MTGTNLVNSLTIKSAKLLGEYEFAERMTEDAVGLDATRRALVMKRGEVVRRDPAS